MILDRLAKTFMREEPVASPLPLVTPGANPPEIQRLGDIPPELWKPYTVEEYLGGHRSLYAHEVTAELVARIEDFLGRVNPLFRELGIRPRLTSGWRPRAYNAELLRKFRNGEPGGANASLNSKHIDGSAGDFEDPDGALDDHLVKNPELLVRFGLYMEHPAHTKNWSHLQSVAPRSGRRVFHP